MSTAGIARNSILWFVSYSLLLWYTLFSLESLIESWWYIEFLTYQHLCFCKKKKSSECCSLLLIINKFGERVIGEFHDMLCSPAVMMKMMMTRSEAQRADVGMARQVQYTTTQGRLGFFFSSPFLFKSRSKRSIDLFSAQHVSILSFSLVVLFIFPASCPICSTVLLRR